MANVNKLNPKLTNTLFVEILSKEYENVKVIKLESNAGSKAGDHNLSDIARISVTFTTNSQEMTKSFVVKFVKENVPFILKLVKGIEKENSWYEDVVPKIEKFNLNFVSKCYKVLDEFLVFEDLCSDGYKVCDRHGMLDLDHCVKAVEALAKFHATTHYLYINNHKQLPEVVVTDMLNAPENKNFMKDRFTRVDSIKKALNDIGIIKYDEILKNFKQNGEEREEKLMENKEFPCLTHGDYWTTNMMFKYDRKGNVENTKIIDFQIIRVTIPPDDLHFFIATSLREVNMDNINKIYEAYLNELNKTLGFLGCPLFPRENFYKLMNDTEFIGVTTALSFLPVVLCEQPLQPPPPHLTEEERKEYSAFDVVYKQKTYQKRLIQLLDFYMSRNVI